MDLKRTACASCGAPVQVAPDVEQVRCAYCGAQLVVERGEGYLAVRAAEEVGRARQELAALRQQERELDERVRTLQAASAPGKDWATAMVLCVLLGWLGAHRFYSGHVLIGLVQLFTGGGFGLWWLIDLGLIASGRYRDSKGLLLGNRNPAVGSGCGWALAVFIAIVFLGGMVAGATDTGSFPTVMLAVALAAGVVVFVLRYWRARREQTSRD